MRRAASTTALILLLLAACTASAEPPHRGPTPDGDAPPTAIPAPTPAPTVKPLSLADFDALRAGLRGKVVVINLWALWCTPCRAEFPDLVAAQRRWAPRGVEFVFVSADAPEQRPEVAAFLAKMGVTAATWQLADSQDAWTTHLGGQPDGSLPSTWILGPDGTVRFFWEGKTTPEKLDARLKTLVEPAP